MWLTSLLTFAFLAWTLSACATPAAEVVSNPSPLPAATAPKSTRQPATTPVEQIAPIPAGDHSCGQWQAWPVIPDLNEGLRQIYERGQDRGNDPQAFSKIGDGEIAADWFLTVFDLPREYYDLGPYQDLVDVIGQFQGSFGRRSLAARRGFNTGLILDVEAADSSKCEEGENPLGCELRLHRPAFAILSLGTNQVWRPDEFEAGMRRILDILLVKSVIPILSTKGDNLEGDHRINRIVACLALEYDVPLWNFWAAIQPLPNHGLQPDLEHLTYGNTDFDDARAMQYAWPVRNLTALQVLDAVWRHLSGGP